MKIGVIQATSQIDKNEILYDSTREVVRKYGYEVINFGCFSDESKVCSYIDVAVQISLYVPTPQDAFLFGRINHGNAVSYPLGLNFDWAGEVNLRCTLEKLFDTPFGTGYPAADADQKKQDTILLKQVNALTKRGASEVFAAMDPVLLQKALSRNNVVNYILQNGSSPELRNLIVANSEKQVLKMGDPNEPV